MCAKGTRCAKLLERETQTKFRCFTQNNLDVHMRATSFSLTRIAISLSPYGCSCEAGGDGGCLAPPAPEKGGCTWEAIASFVMVHVSDEKNRKQDYD